MKRLFLKRCLMLYKEKLEIKFQKRGGKPTIIKLSAERIGKMWGIWSESTACNQMQSAL